MPARNALTLIELPIPARREHRPPAFTLIELLVVVTIIVILIALLTPALDRAIYQGELAVCGAQCKTIVSGVTLYAGEHRRAYPMRLPEGSAWEGLRITDPNYDLRPAVAPYYGLRAMVDPLAGKIRLDDGSSPPDSTGGAFRVLYSSYELYFGWRFAGEKGMKRMGDRFEWRGQRFSVLAGDRDLRDAQQGSGVQASHPDDEQAMALWAFQDEYSPWDAQNVWLYWAQNVSGAGDDRNASPSAFRVTFTWWQTYAYRRGRIDTNFGFDDGRVVRYNGVEIDDNRMGGVPEYADGAQYDAGRVIQTPEDD